MIVIAKYRIGNMPSIQWAFQKMGNQRAITPTEWEEIMAAACK